MKKIRLGPNRFGTLRLIKQIGIGAFVGFGIYNLAKRSSTLIKSSTPLLAKVNKNQQMSQLQTCINNSKQAINDLRALSTETSDLATKATLEESAHHLEMSILECEYAVSQI